MGQDRIERISRLTPLQDGMFFEALRKQGTSEVIYQVCLELRGSVRGALLREAWRTVVYRHPILRTSFHYENLDVPVQVAWRDVTPPWTEVDWPDADDEECLRRLTELTAEDRRRPFALTEAPLLRLTFIRAGEDRSWLIWTYHHLLLDGWSTYLVLDDVSRCYRDLAAGRRPDRPSPRPYWEYVAWLQERQEVRAAEQFWRDQLAGLTGPTPLGYEDVPVEAAAAEFDEVVSWLPMEVAGRLDALARRHRLTLGTMLQAAWAIALSRYSERDDVVFGTIVSGRPPEFEGIDELVGLFINVVPVRVQVDPAAELLSWLSGLQDRLAEIRQYEHTPLSTVQRLSGLRRGVALFESLVVFINYPVRKGWTDGGEVQVTGTRVLQQPHYPLHLTGVPGREGWLLTLGYDPGRFSRSLVGRLAELVMAMLTAFADEPTRRLADLPAWTATPPLAVLAAVNELPAVPVRELLLAAAARGGDAAAVVCEDRQISRRDLFARAGRIAAALRRAGVRPGVPVAVRCQPAVSTVLGVLATMLAGGVLVPLDADASAGAMASALLAAGDPVVLVNGADDPLCTVLPAYARPVDLCLVEMSDAQGGDPSTDARPAGTDPALFLPHRAQPAAAFLRQTDLGRLIWRLQRAMPLEAADRVRLAGPAHRMARDLLWILAAGAALAIDGPATVALLDSGGVAALGADAPAALGPDLPTRRVVCSPGPIPSALRHALLTGGRLELIEELPAELGGGVLVGAGWPEPVNLPGEARVRGSARVFPGPDVAPQRRSGDPESRSGEADLWAVAAVLHRHPAVADAVARVLADPDGGEETLVAYLAPVRGKDTRGVAPAELQELVASRLPARLVPDAFVVVDAIRRDRDGAVDVAALPSPRRTTTADWHTDPVQELVAAIWAQALERPVGELDATANFFDLGGHSLLAIRLVSRLRAAFGANFSLTDLFADPTIAGVARCLRTALAGGTGAADDAIPRAPRDRPLPASFGQERLWFVDQLDDAAANNIMLPSRLRQDVDADALRRAVAGLLDRHEVLRTCLREQDGAVVQVILDRVPPPVRCDDLSGRPAAEAERTARQLLEEDVARRFDLATEVPVRVRLIRLGPQDTVLGVCVHHAAFDGWSTGVLFADLGELYRAALEDRPPRLPELPAQYADFAVWQRERLTGDRLRTLVDYWRERLDGVPDLQRLTPQPARRPAERTGSGGLVERDLPGDRAAAVRALAGQEASTPFMVLLAAYGVLLARHTGHHTVVVGSPVAGREVPALEPLVGLFVNTLVLPLDLSGEPTFRALVQRVRAATLGALAHRDMPFERLVSLLAPRRSAERMPLVQVSFNLQNTPYQPLRMADSTASFFPIRQEVPRFELTAELYEWQGGLRCVFHYAEDVYHRRFVEALADEYADLVGTLLDAPDQPIGTAQSLDLPAAESLTLLRSLGAR